ncbi:MAG TPA: glycosyltransferase family 2 protein [Solirubrobacteraceae bacterium]|nr:glycosyltransferase family 2 protein [Solirubrobacteraceae bacterium]
MFNSIDVVVVAYGHYHLTDSCLRHLKAQTLDHRVIVVDNGSADDTRARLRSEWPDVQLECIDRNHGFPKACNRGVAAGSGEIVVLLNNDVDCRPDFLERLVAPLEDPRVGSVASLVLQSNERSVDSVGVTSDITLAGFQRLHGMPVEHARDRLPLVAGPEGTAGAYRRTAWEQVGGLDETIPAYMDIFDLALRLRNAGWGAASAPDAIGVHLGSATYGSASPARRRLAGFGRGYVLRRYGVLRSRAAGRALLTEAVVVLADALMSGDLAALRGRIAGWQAGAGHERRPPPPSEAIDTGIGFWDSLALRRRVYRAP